MKKSIIFVPIFFTMIALASCVTLKEPAVVQNGNLQDYHYVVLSSTVPLTSSSGSTINGYYYSTSKSVNPSDVIVGYLAKKGFIILPELQNDLLNETLIVNYGESGRREVFWGYTTEVTIQFVNAQSKKLVIMTTAEGIGDTETDDIKEAITRALDALF